MFSSASCNIFCHDQDAKTRESKGPKCVCKMVNFTLFASHETTAPGPSRHFTFLVSGSLWDPHMAAAVSVDKEHKTLSVVVSFEAALSSERYQVFIQSHGFNYSKTVSKVIRLPSYD